MLSESLPNLIENNILFVDKGQYSVAEEVALGNVPVGFDLRASPVPLDDISSLRFRGDFKSLLTVRRKRMFFQECSSRNVLPNDFRNAFPNDYMNAIVNNSLNLLLNECYNAIDNDQIRVALND